MKTSKNSQPKVSKSYQKVLDNVAKYQKLENERDLSQRELVLYANALQKIEDKSLSKIFKMITDKNSPIAPQVKLILGNVKPTFKTLQQNMSKIKAYYSVYDALCAMARMNPSAKLATKLKKQGGKVLKNA